MAYLSLLVMIVSTLMQHNFVYTSEVTDWCIDDLEDPYHSVLDFTNSSGIAQAQLQDIIESVLTRAGCYWLQSDPVNDMNCSNCLHASDIYQHYFNMTATDVLTVQQFNNVSTILTSYVFQLKTMCATINPVNWTTVTYSYFSEQLMHIADMFSDHVPHHEDEQFTVGQLETLLRNVSDSYIPGQKLDKFTAVRPQDVASTCTFANLRSVDSYLLMDAVAANHSEAIDHDRLDLLSSHIVSQLLHGSCISTAEPEIANSNAFVQSIYETFGAGHSCVFNETGITEIMSKLGLNPPEHDHDHEHEHSVTGLSAADKTTQHNAVSISQYHQVDVKITCLDIDNIFTSFNIEDADKISRTDFYKLCPALLQQAVIGCAAETATPSDSPKPSAAEAYGYGTLAVFVICLLSTAGLIIVKFQNTKVYNFILVAMLGLGVGSLVGDSLLHLVPQALGLHDHSHDGSSHGTGVTVEDYTWKMLACCGSVWAFYVLQLSLIWIGRIIKRRSSTTHPGTPASIRTDDAAINPSETVDKFNSSTTAVSVVEDPSTYDSVGNGVKATPVGDNNDVFVADSASSSSRRHSVVSLSHAHVHSTVAWMVTIGDALHNFTDGLAIGASFGLSWSAGLSTTIAVACHELPHEFGDVAILLSAGWSPLKVLMFQLFSASTAFIGLYIGIAVSDDSEVVQQWIFAVAAGLFIYVALTDVIPELVEYFERGNATLMFLISNGGIFLGFLAMSLLAIFEEQIVIN